MDGNAVPDYWTGDWSGFCRIAAPGGAPCGMIDPQVAAADASPLPRTDGPRPRLGETLPPKPYKGYWFAALKKADGKPLAVDGPEGDGKAWGNLRGYAFVAYPAKYGVSGRRTFVTREDGAIWGKDCGPGGAAPEEWPAAGAEEMRRAGWSEVQ